MDPIVGSALISGGASLLAGAGGAASSANLNAKNRNFQREMYNQQRADAVADMQTQMDFQRESWAYGSLPNQVALAKQAGINPAAVFGNNGSQTGISGSIGARGSAVPLPSATANPWDSVISVLSGLMRSIPNYFQAQSSQQNAETSAKMAENDSLRTFAETLKKSKEANLIDAQTSGQLIKNALSNATFEDQVSLMRGNVEKQRAEIDNILGQTEMYSGLCSLYKTQIDELKARIEEHTARIENIRADTSLTPQRRDILIEQANTQYTIQCRNEVERQGIELRNQYQSVINDIEERTKEGTITKEQAEAEIAAFRNKTKEADRIHRLVQGYVFGAADLANSAALSYRSYTSPRRTIEMVNRYEGHPTSFSWENF